MRRSSDTRTREPRHAATFVRVYAAAAALFLLLLHGFFTLQARLDDARAKVAMHGSVDYAADILANTLSSYATDIKVLSRLGRVRALAAGDLSVRDAVIDDFRVFVGEKPVTAQLRFIDATGRERVRVDRVGDRVVVIPDDGLQDKSDRYYFRDAIGLPETEVYVSPVDLNVEHNAIEVPWNPMLRLARTLRDGDGAPLGMVIINVKAGDLITGIEHAPMVGAALVQWLNGAGFWLAGVPEERLWGFMFGRDTTMAKIDPAAWAIIGPDTDRGEFSIGDAAYVYRALAPATIVSDAPEAEPARTSLDDWKVVGTVRLSGLADIWTLQHAGLAVAGLVLIGGICLGWDRANAARINAEHSQRATEEELVRIERFASLGSLVAGVAHELNTPVGSAVTVASTMAERVKGFRAEVEGGQLRRAALAGFLDDMREGTEIMLGGLDRTARLVQQFKQVAFDQTSQKRRTFSLRDLVADVVGTMRPQFNHAQIVLDSEIATETRLDSYPGPLGQVLINLISNARTHGFDEGAAGRITISARDAPNGTIVIVVRDTGKGMPEEVRRRAFEPFFTTRLGQGGSGLGLSITFNIVTGILGGTIDAESKPGEGTAMIVCVPAIAPAETAKESGRIYDVGR